MVSLEVFNHQLVENITDDLLEKLSRCGNEAIALVLDYPSNGGGVLGGLEEVEVSIVSDGVIAQVHDDFMDVPGATDVITFAHGEIVISAETAREYGVMYGNSLERELMLYIIHGLLHLVGHEDKDLKERGEMEKIQTHILEQVWIS